MLLTDEECTKIMKQIGCTIKALTDLHTRLLVLKEQIVKKDIERAIK